MKLLVGLGNPAEKYLATRHNLGFEVLGSLLAKMTSVEKTAWQERKGLKAQLARVGDTTLARPLTAMNDSGRAIKLLLDYYKLPPGSLWLVHDDLDVPLGKLKIAQGRGAAGHRGVTSVIEALGSIDFVRFRVGIGKEKIHNPEKYVLSPFAPQEQDEAAAAIKKAVSAIEFALREGIEAAMSRYNQ